MMNEVRNLLFTHNIALKHVPILCAQTANYSYISYIATYNSFATHIFHSCKPYIRKGNLIALRLLKQ